MNYQTLHNYGLLFILVSAHTSVTMAQTNRHNSFINQSAITKLSPKKELNTFSYSDPISGGELYCYQIGYFQNCYAFQNLTKNDYLCLKFDDYSRYEIKPRQVVAVKHPGENPGIIHAEVTNKNSDETLFDNQVVDMRGLTCSAKQCHSWD